MSIILLHHVYLKRKLTDFLSSACILEWLMIYKLQHIKSLKKVH